MALDARPRYSIPTHLTMPDTIDLPLFGITVSLTMRQGVCFLVGGSVVFHLWQASLALGGMMGFFAHWAGPFVLACLTYVIAVHSIRDRHLEEWMIVCWQYWSHPTVFVWCSVLSTSTLLQVGMSSDEIQEPGRQNLDDEENKDV
ncbi:MAG: hypothetical protein H0V70_14815 [Ktedonobacteraceae bacterium]|nr:hypothetical protein [Ktedonobacteraceae bacterium]